MSKHTPGPWVVKSDGAVWVTDATGWRSIAPIGKREGAEQMANARLIAAAPDLVRDIASLIEVLENNCKLNQFAIRDQDIIARARLTLAKATGGAE